MATNVTQNVQPQPIKIVSWLRLLGIGGFILVGDQVAKWLTVTHLDLYESWHVFPQVSSFIKVMYTQNSGAAFGIFPGGSNIFLVVALITTAIFVWMYPRLPAEAQLSIIGIPLIVGGALSNAIDRLRFDYVIDYFYVQVTPTMGNISNFADHAITIGVILLLVDQWLLERREARASEQAAPQGVYAADIHKRLNIVRPTPISNSDNPETDKQADLIDSPHQGR